MGHFGQAVGLAAHRGDNNHYLMALVAKAFNFFRHGLDTVDRAHRGAAELLYV